MNPSASTLFNTDWGPIGGTMTTAPEEAKAAGFKNLSEVAEIVGQKPQKLDYWHRAMPELFRIVLLGCAADKEGKDKPKASHWYCHYCEQRLNERDVTFNQRHAYCGNVAKWVEAG